MDAQARLQGQLSFRGPLQGGDSKLGQLLWLQGRYEQLGIARGLQQQQTLRLGLIRHPFLIEPAERAISPALFVAFHNCLPQASHNEI